MSHNLIRKFEVSNHGSSFPFTPIENEVSDEQRKTSQKNNQKEDKAPWGSLGIPRKVHVNENDIYDYEYRLANAISLIHRSTKISLRDKDLIRGFDRVLQATNVSVGRRAKYLFHLKTIGENFGLSFESAARQDVENFVGGWLNKQGYKAQTRIDYIIILKRFFKFVRTGSVDREEPFPIEVRFLKSTMKANERELPEFLAWSEVELMIKVSDNHRDRAMLSVGFEAGLRASELLLMNVGDISFDDLGARARIRHGKTGSRLVRLISSAPILAQFLEVHPRKRDPSAPLWLTESTNHLHERMSWLAWSRRLKQTARDAGLSKRKIHNHLLRHGSATLAAKFLSDSELKVRYGWSMTSKMAAIYVHLSSSDLDEKLSHIYTGRDIKPTRPELSPLLCARCGETNSPGTRFCGRCATPLDPKELESARFESQSVLSQINEMRGALSHILNDGKSRDKTR
jgi:integrase/recombinase XerD